MTFINIIFLLAMFGWVWRSVEIVIYLKGQPIYLQVIFQNIAIKYHDTNKNDFTDSIYIIVALGKHTLGVRNNSIDQNYYKTSKLWYFIVNLTVAFSSS